MICRIIQCHPFIRQNQFTCTFNVVISCGYGRPSGSFFMTDTCAAFFELLYPFKYTCSRQNAFLILCTKCLINIGTRHALQPQNMNHCMLLFFRANHKWGIHKRIDVTRSNLNGIDLKDSDVIRKVQIGQYSQQNF